MTILLMLSLSPSLFADIRIAPFLSAYTVDALEVDSSKLIFFGPDPVSPVLVFTNQVVFITENSKLGVWRVRSGSINLDHIRFTVWTADRRVLVLGDGESKAIALTEHGLTKLSGVGGAYRGASGLTLLKSFFDPYEGPASLRGIRLKFSSISTMRSYGDIMLRPDPPREGFAHQWSMVRDNKSLGSNDIYLSPEWPHITIQVVDPGTVLATWVAWRDGTGVDFRLFGSVQPKGQRQSFQGFGDRMNLWQVWSPARGVLAAFASPQAASFETGKRLIMPRGGHPSKWLNEWNAIGASDLHQVLAWRRLGKTWDVRLARLRPGPGKVKLASVPALR